MLQAHKTFLSITTENLSFDTLSDENAV